MEEPINLRLKRLRKNKGLSQEAAAEKLKVSRQTINNWESHRTVPDYYQLLKIKEVYGVTWGYLMEEVDKDGRELAESCIGVIESFLEDVNQEDTHMAIKEFKAGYCDITIENLNDTFGYFNFDFPRLADIAICLKEKGYIITSIYENGFGIYFRTNEEAANAYNDLESIVDKCIHHWEKDPTDYNEISDRYFDGIQKATRYSYEKIFGIPEDKKEYYCLYDKHGELRGFGNTKAECEKLAKEQNLENHRIELGDEI